MAPSAHAAAKAGDLAALTAALAAGAAIDAPWGDGNTPLHEAALCGSVDCVSLLLSKGAAVDSRGLNGATPFIFAAGNATPAVLELLLAAGADVNAASNQGATALMNAAIRGRPETTAWLLAHGADVQHQSGLRQTALSFAASGPSKKEDAPNRAFYPVVAKLLLDAGAQVDSRDNDGWTPLYAAAACGETEMVKLLISHGADVMARDAGTGLMPIAATPLHQACAGRHADTVQVLLKAGASENAVDNQGRRPVDALPLASGDAARDACEYYLYHAAELDETPGKRLSEVLKQGEKGTVDVAKVLAFFDTTAEGKNALGINEPVMRLDGETPLGFVACLRGPAWCQLARELIAKGADVNQVSAAGMNETPLFAAASLGSLEMVQLLLRAGANVNWAKTGPFEGFTPLIECLSSTYRGGDGREDTALALLASGARTDIVLKKQPNEGLMPLHCAIKAGFLRATKAIMERGGPGADVYARAGFYTALMMADYVTLSKGDSSIEDYLKEVAPPPPPQPESRCVIS